MTIKKPTINEIPAKLSDGSLVEVHVAEIRKDTQSLLNSTSNLEKASQNQHKSIEAMLKAITNNSTRIISLEKIVYGFLKILLTIVATGIVVSGIYFGLLPFIK